MRLPEEPEIPPTINVTSLIDVTFSILAFFLFSTLFLTKNLGLPVNLPKAQTATPQPKLRYTVTVNAKGDIFLNQVATPLTDLAVQINRQRGAQEAVVLLQVDQEAKHGRAIAVLDRLRQIEGVRPALAVQAE
ncbi:MAG: biopolymer transporter ExbD [Oscillatoriales cyanobacterium SM2_1_8]|nr:biopolymer transporter ExbD [Oscillatoriales cyanobacterium SM2_1_8]